MTEPNTPQQPPAAPDQSDHHSGTGPAKAGLAGSAMFLPALIVLAIAIVVILVIVL